MNLRHPKLKSYAARGTKKQIFGGEREGSKTVECIESCGIIKPDQTEAEHPETQTSCWHSWRYYDLPVLSEVGISPPVLCENGFPWWCQAYLCNNQPTHLPSLDLSVFLSLKTKEMTETLLNSL